MAKYWESVRSPGRAPHDDEVRGSFFLYFYPHEDERAWKKISKLTLGDKLGYMSSISPDFMFCGPLEGSKTICVHTLDEGKEKARVKAALRKANLGGRIYKYDLIHRFRTYDYNYGDWIQNSKGKIVKYPLNDECYTDEESELEDSSDEMDTDYESEQSTDVVYSEEEEDLEDDSEEDSEEESESLSDDEIVSTERATKTKSGKMMEGKCLLKRIREPSPIKTVTRKPLKRCAGQLKKSLKLKSK